MRRLMAGMIADWLSSFYVKAGGILIVFGFTLWCAAASHCNSASLFIQIIVFIFMKKHEY